MKKIILLVLLALALYWGFGFARVARLGVLFSDCASPTDLDVYQSTTISTEEKLKVSNKVFTCAKEKQNFIDRIFHIVPDAWTHP